jgi:hypothetical protein
MLDTEAGGVPKRLTPNQVVAYNMATYRRVAGITQADLAVELEDRTLFVWTKATVSAAERSWETDRSKQFDATQLFALCDIFQVPIIAFFVLPERGGPWIIEPKINWQMSYRVASEVAPTWSAKVWWRTLSGAVGGQSKAWEDYQRRRTMAEEDPIAGNTDMNDLTHAIDAVANLHTMLIKIRDARQTGT